MSTTKENKEELKKELKEIDETKNPESGEKFGKEDMRTERARNRREKFAQLHGRDDAENREAREKMEQEKAEQKEKEGKDRAGAGR